MQMRRRAIPPTTGHRGFTLVEVLIVVVLLGILASVVLPQFNGASTGAKEAALMQNLQVLRGQIQLYAVHHDGRLPAWNETTEVKLTDSLLYRSDRNGTRNDTSGTCGPYLIGGFPANPYNGLRSVRVATTDGVADDSTGWIYNSATGTCRANCTGLAASGEALWQF